MEPFRKTDSRYHQVPSATGRAGRTSSSSGDYSDSCSSSECSSSSWNSSFSIPEWESHVDARGELFYVQFGSNLNPTETKPERQSDTAEQQNVSKKKKSRLSRLLKRREGNKKKITNMNVRSRSESPVYMPTESLQHSPADDWSDWASFTLELEVHPAPLEDSSTSSGRRKNGNLCEILLGFTPGVTQSVEWHGQAALRQRVVVDRLVPGGPLHQGFAHVQQGDWLEKLNGRDVTHRDLNDILSSINSREIVELNFRRRPPPHHHQQQQPQEHPSGKSSRVNQEVNAVGATSRPSLPHGVLLLSQENVTDASPETADILYQGCWTTAMTGGTTGGGGGGGREGGGIEPILKWRGAAVTLAHLMPQLTGSTPSGSTVILDGLSVHLAYIVEGSALLLIAAPSTWCSMIELQLTTRQLGALFRFQYGSIRRALTEPRWADEIRRIVDSLFVGLMALASHQKQPSGENSPRPINRLSDFFSTSGQWLPLPPDCHLDVTLTLNQMEAMDYEDWDEDDINVQRCVTITGSAVYCQGYLVASTLTGQRLQELGTFLKWNQILEMSHRRRLQQLVLWREVFVAGEDGTDGGRSFIVVVGSGHILIAALLQGGGVAQPWDNYPDTFLIDEMLFFLEELEYLDLESVCNQILNGPQNPALVTNLSGGAVEARAPDTLTFNISPGVKPTLINYVSMDFGTGMLIAPTVVGGTIKFVKQFHKTSLTIHKLFQQTLKAKMDLQRPDWGGPWSDKSLVALQEVSALFSVPETPSSPSGTTKWPIKESSFWVTGRLFTSPVHRELFVCYQDGVAQDILDLAFHLGFGAII